ncbi:L,D-transpeptidase family protein [Streptomyces sp. ME02-8801-2C]|uniref:L,D-transpeptidase family protein n=1 Tax=Streptomyces sp. ME02-8801-2C TaxID=3028680 RepID=UPI0029B8B079|nr:L,D-transpeptidase family protein [Streptomyces sp. ME02-8801-2C]MDX3457771.1 L,D-transpeptidase family protein [Streptomyces sp. ME02-8801-2C]
MRHLFSSLGSRLPVPAPVPVLALTLTLALAGCGGPGGPGGAGATGDAPSTATSTQDARAVPPGTADAGSGPNAAGGAAATPAPAASADLPGLGPRTLARVPATARQVLVVTGEDKNSPSSQVVLYRRTGDGWIAGRTWAAHNALRGWTEEHHAGDLRSPIGVFTLSDAGGLLTDPGTKLPYDRSSAFTIGGTGFEGEPLAGSFDYVVAIDYNRRRGTSPLDWTRPLGANKGGGIWLHVDHGGPTHGCVSLAPEHMKDLLRTLDPALHPVIVMGDDTSLER